VSFSESSVERRASSVERRWFIQMSFRVRSTHRDAVLSGVDGCGAARGVCDDDRDVAVDGAVEDVGVDGSEVRSTARDKDGDGLSSPFRAGVEVGVRVGPDGRPA